MANKLIYKCLFKLIPYEYVKKLYNEHSDLLEIKQLDQDRILKAKAKAEIDEFLAKKPSNYLETLTKKIKPDLVPWGYDPFQKRPPLEMDKE